MLEATSEYQVSEERIFSDAFTELCVPTGGKAKVYTRYEMRILEYTVHICLFYCYFVIV